MKLMTAAFTPNLEVYREHDGGVQLARATGDPATGDANVDAAYDHATEGLHMLHQRLGWNGWDGHGTVLKVVANSSHATHWKHDEGTMYLSATSDGETHGRSSAQSDDVVWHELGHGVAMSRAPSMSSARKMDLHQTLANVIAMAFDTDDWKLGEDTYSAWRVFDYSNPTRRFAESSSTAMAMIGDAVGRDTMLKVFFEAMPRMTDSTTVSSAAADTIVAARTLGLAPETVTKIADAWRRAGVEVQSAQ